MDASHRRRCGHGRRALWTRGMHERMPLLIALCKTVEGHSAVRFRQSRVLRLLSGGPGGFRRETKPWRSTAHGRGLDQVSTSIVRALPR